MHRYLPITLLSLIGFVILSFFTISTVFGVEEKEQINVPTFTDQDLEKYSNKPIADPESIYPLPSTPPQLKDGDRIFKENVNAVVLVVAYNKEGNPITHGSGFIIRKDGAIITSYHIVPNAADIKVKTANRILPVEGVLYMDKENDMVILKANGEDLHAVNLGNSNEVEVGEKVYVISNPKGTENILSEGIVSGMKDFGSERVMIQLTAHFSQGSSGGPVFNARGEVIGVATSTLKEARNFNFAVPINLVKDKVTTRDVMPLMDALIEDKKEMAEYWIHLGNSYNESGNYSEGLDAHQQAIRISPDLAEAHNRIGITYMHLKKYTKAINAFKEAIRIQPDSAWFYSNLGLVYAKSGKFGKAIDTLKEAIRMTPDLAAAHLNLGRIYKRFSKNKEALDSYYQAIRINPDLADAHFDLGVIYSNLKDMDSAMEEYEILKDLDTELADKLYNLINK